MSGHSKWSSIKHKKARTDATRGKVFTKLIREITVAAREGGGDSEANSRLRLAIQSAKAQNMPNDNIQRAIKKGTGDTDGVRFEESTYEGYGPAGVALLIDVLTDNKNRTTAEVRHALTKWGGNLGESGCVAWNFETKGVIRVNKEQCDEETLLEVALEGGADDVNEETDFFEVYTEPASLIAVSEAMKAGNIPYETAEVEKLPKSLVKVDGKDATKVLKLMEMLEDLDDVQRVSANFDIPDEVFHQE
ncbi:MAG: YebC/PmpR family DNA-binding transcriptional regulator [Candidatus Krumholzibacteria bacterium]|nr:YebC/PmpR family DNA-binding transcriptional regulator [Candidatus Krumholzibacteria bacterium]